MAARHFFLRFADNEGNERDRQFEIDISVYPKRVRKTDPIIVFGDVSTRTCKDELAANGQTPGLLFEQPHAIRGEPATIISVVFGSAKKLC